MDELVTLSGTVHAVTFENRDNGFAVLQVADENGDIVTAVGPLAGCLPGEELEMEGSYTEHPSFGQRFEAERYSVSLPETESAIMQYLASGALPGIGAATARRIVKQFGDEALEVLAGAPERLAAVPGMSPAKAKAASEAFLEHFNVREALVTLAKLGLTATESMAVYRRYDVDTVDLLHRNPYALCGEPLYLPIQRVDTIAGDLHFERDSAERNRAALLYTLRFNLRNGHTCLPADRLVPTASGFFGVPEEVLYGELDALADEALVGLAEVEERPFAALMDWYRAEKDAAFFLRRLMAHTPPAPEGLAGRIEALELNLGIQYAPLQKQAIETALSSGAMVLTGGPGTGKTTAINGIIALFEQQADRVFLAAPTGRAAKRLAEVTGREAFTLHRLLEAEYAPEAGRARFRRNSERPLRCDVLIVDEMSMVDGMLFESLLAALKPSARLVMVGDADQLPSVGAGNVLREVVASGVVPVVSLTEIFRQAAESLIVRNAHHIVEGSMPEKGGRADDWFFLPAFGQQAQDLVCDLVARRLPASYGLSPLGDIQVLCPGHNGALGTQALRARLQEELNPAAMSRPELKYGSVVFRLGDKVMQVKNNYDIPYTRDDGEPGAGAFNGDIGTVEEVNAKTHTLTVYSEGRHVYYAAEHLRELELAYAVTIHKSQGSEFEAVVLCLSDVAPKLQYRNLLYTGVTRARRLCVLVGESEVLRQMVNNGRRNTRYSALGSFLQEEEG